MIEFRMSPHTKIGMPAIVEVWHRGKFVASIYAMPNDGHAIVRVLSKHPMTVAHEAEHAVAEVRVSIEAPR